jgi:hypothetical protein
MLKVSLSQYLLGIWDRKNEVYFVLSPLIKKVFGLLKKGNGTLLLKLLGPFINY